MIKNCRQCGGEFNSKPSEEREFCSITCSNKSRKGIPRPRQSALMSGNKNPRWSNRPNGNMDNLHQWIHKRKPKPKLCEMCHKKPPVDCANISQEYKEDPNDFIWLCRACHIRQDGRIKNLTQFREKL